ncbi:MAG: hypothetical protein LUQ26_02365, partial [Methylococcaceae bacterium]|nr:hypothetical protein [Methylococcaceae bacterium]
GHYQDVVSVVRKQIPDDGWKNIKFMVFDLPAHGGTFTERVEDPAHCTLPPQSVDYKGLQR